MSKRHVVLDQKNRTKSAKTFCFCIGYLTCQSNLSRSILPSLFFFAGILHSLLFPVREYFSEMTGRFSPCDNSPVVAFTVFTVSQLPFCISLCIALTSLPLTRNISLSPTLSPHTHTQAQTHTHIHARWIRYIISTLSVEIPFQFFSLIYNFKWDLSCPPPLQNMKLTSVIYFSYIPQWIIRLDVPHCIQNTSHFLALRTV